MLLPISPNFPVLGLQSRPRRTDRIKRGWERKKEKTQTRDNLCPDLEASFLVTQNNPIRCFLHLAATQANPRDATPSAAKPPGPFSPPERRGQRTQPTSPAPQSWNPHQHTPPNVTKPYLRPLSCPLSSHPTHPHFSFRSQHLFRC